MLFWVVLKILFTTNEPHCFFACSRWTFKTVCSLPVSNNILYSWKSAISHFCWIWCEDFFMGLSYHSPVYTHIMRSLLFFCFSLFFLMAIVWWVVLGSLYHMWNSPDTFLRNCCLARLCPPGPGHSFLSVRLLTSSSCIKCLVFQSTFYLYFLFIIYSPQKSSLSQFHVFMQKKHLISVPIHLVQTLPRMFLAQARGLRPDISSCSWLPYFLGTHRPFPMIWHLYIQSCDGGKTLSKDESWKEPDWQ